MERYRIYDIDNGKVLGVDGQAVKEFNTDAQARKWVDGEVKLGEKKIEENNLTAWYTGDGNWTIAEDGGSWTVGAVKIETQRERIEDHYGMKKFRIRVTSQVKVTLRITISDRITIDEVYKFGKGQIATLREVMRLNDVFKVDTRRQMEIAARAKGNPEYQIIGCFDANTETHIRNLWALCQ